MQSDFCQSMQEMASISQKTLEHIKKDVKEETSEERERNKLQEGVQVKVTTYKHIL